MVEFYADWCPACQKMEESWNKFGDWCTDRCKGATCNETRVGRVDITVSPFLTGKSLSEALIFASTNPQHDDRLFIELQVQYMKIPSSNMGRTRCVQKLFLTFRTIFVFSA